MPHIPNHIADCSIYLYDSEDDANVGKRSGGSGFIIHVPSTVDGFKHVYAVTNRHVIDGGSCVIRINTKQGDAVPISTIPEDWEKHPEGDDVTIYDLSIAEDYKYWSISTDLFITPEIITVYRIGYGDEVFLVGRLIAHSGNKKNTPVIRFGNISLMADSLERILYRGKEQEAFLIECRSISGFSGSPVFAITSQTYHGEDAKKLVAFRQKEMNYDPATNESGLRTEVVSMSFDKAGPWLLGIDFGHLPFWSPIRDGSKPTNLIAETNTGIAGVVPSWKIRQILDGPTLSRRRALEDKKILKAKSR